jgi:hypothetical protein
MRCRRWESLAVLGRVLLLSLCCLLAACNRQPVGSPAADPDESLFAEGELPPLPPEEKKPKPKPVPITRHAPITSTRLSPSTKPEATQPVVVAPPTTRPVRPVPPDLGPAKTPWEHRANLSDEKAKDTGKPISAMQGAVGDLLRKWYAEKTAAGNIGDYYDNRDRGHSPLDLTPFPQLTAPAVYPENRKNFTYGRMMFLLNHVTIGNSSTSFTVQTMGSNPRCYYCEPKGVEFLYEQYRNNNLYVYPAHHDHTPWVGPYGDLFPVNTPYLIISEGSSLSDLPFLQALAPTLAAFRPEVKQKLKETGLLMPTLQMIFRMCNKTVTDPKLYLTGIAHPSIFNAGWIDLPKMVQMAHDIRLDSIPPMIQLRVVEEDTPLLGRDYFDAGRSEVLCDTPAAIGRIFRGTKATRRVVVSAEQSYDINKKPLTFHWQVLRCSSSPGSVSVKPLNASGSVAEIIVSHHPSFRVQQPSAIDTTRVDIGAFVHNGTHYSAPGFVSFFSLKNETRLYGPHGPVEIGYGTGEGTMTVLDWAGLFEVLKPGAAGLAGQLLVRYLQPTELTALREEGEKYRKLAEPLYVARPKLLELLKADEKALAAVSTAEQQWLAAAQEHAKAQTQQTKVALDKAAAQRTAALEARKATQAAYTAAYPPAAVLQAANDLLNRDKAGLHGPIPHFFAKHFWHRVLGDVNLYMNHRDAIEAIYRAADEPAKARFDAARRRAVHLGTLRAEGNTYTVRALRAGPEPLETRLTPYEKVLLQRFNADVLALIYHGTLAAGFTETYVDSRLAYSGKCWRDVYKYDPAGHCTGWTRYSPEGEQEFTADGLLVLAKDTLGRAVKARKVSMHTLPAGKAILGNEVATFEYAGPKDFQGRIANRGPIDEKK